MLQDVVLPIDQIYVPAKHRGRLDEGKVEEIAESIIDEGQRTPIQVRQGKGRYVLVTGLHRLEAMRSLGEDTIKALIVSAPKN
ncbi:MAG: ParB N-terminal domain-containing protein [Alphaproteobacteria bacterium]|nr:ParB N-terminal domain-containing protein [Alphaproteobacteria bacterium]MDP6567392.1 ParB N-terminal domain-containing protein [Alphaproteobacteria bacterium]MDP6814832.1 ParB N-terminal domain-containing protein [Alphaproteobacteria bacterium]